MKDTDRALMYFAVVAAALVVVAFALVARQPTAHYGPDDTPEGVVSNYLLAVTRGDYARAYAYLSTALPGRPSTVEAFVDQSGQLGWDPGAGAAVFKAELASTTGARAVVRVRSTRFVGGELLGANEFTETFNMRLAPVDGTWRLVGGDRYWYACWENPSAAWCSGTPPAPPQPQVREAP